MCALDFKQGSMHNLYFKVKAQRRREKQKEKTNVKYLMIKSRLPIQSLSCMVVYTCEHLSHFTNASN